MEDRNIQVLQVLKIADPTLVKHIAVFEHVGLTGDALSKTIEYGLRNRVGAVGDRVDAAVPLAGNQIGIGTVAKCQLLMAGKNPAIGRILHRMSHRSSYLRAG